MAKKTKQNSFFKDTSLSLKREQNKARESLRDKNGKHPGNKGFIRELNEQAETREAYKAGKKAGQTASLFKGQDITTRKKEQSVDFSVDPSKVEKESGDKGFAEQMNNRLDWQGIKK